MERPILNHFYNYDEICDYLFAAKKEYPDVMQLDELARTDEDRVIWGVTLAKGNPEDKPALYVQGGVHAQEGMGITCSLNFLWTVLQQQELLDKLTFYILPCVNPDGSDLCVRTGISVRSKLEIIPGLRNSVIPADLDGDGKILSMRWKDPMGPFVCVPGCGDFMVRRTPEDEGPFYDMCTEGEVENYDGGVLEQYYRDLDFNRQYALDWKDNYNGGDFPGNHIEPATVMRFLVAHPNIFAVMDIHCGTRALIYSDPANAADAALMQKLADLCNEVTGIEPITHGNYARRSGAKATHLYGHIDSFCYEGLGVPSVTVELGNGYNSMGMTAQEVFDGNLYGRELMTKIVAMHAAKGRVIAEPWKPYKHPQLGDVEIGGQIHSNAYFMDPDDMLDLIPKVADYFLEVIKLVPVLALGGVTCDAMGGGVYRIRAHAYNRSRVNTKMMQGSAGYHANNYAVEIKVSGVKEILSRTAVASVASLAPMQMYPMEWFVRAEPGDTITIEATHPKAIKATESVVAP